MANEQDRRPDRNEVDQQAQNRLIDELSRSEQRYRMLVDNLHEIIFQADDRLRFTFLNRAWLIVTGTDATGRQITDFIAESGQVAWEEFLQARSNGAHKWHIPELCLRHADGKNHWVTLFIARDDPQSGWIGSMHDITKHKQVEEELRLAASVFTHAREGITITDAEGTIIDVNDTFTHITGYTREEAVGRNPRFLKSGYQDPDFYAAMWRDLTEKGYWYGEIWNRRKNGEVFAEMLTISAVRDDQDKTQNYVGLFSDITSLKEHARRLEHIAHYDALTGLPNRRLLADRLQQAIAQVRRRGQQLAVVYLDLDGFKSINDAHTHEVGDQLLIIEARRMKEALRESDTIARLGGDEFVTVLTDLAKAEESVPMLDRLLSAIAKPVHIGDLVLQVSASLGVTFYPQTDDVDADQLIRQADQAMYQAKMAGKNRYHFFDAEQDRAAKGHHESIEQVSHALAEREFVLHYQPKVNMRTGEVIGAEALIRWQHPERGLLSPAVFLPVIEDHPMSVQLGEWVIDTALAQMETWHAAGLDMPVSVNVGGHQLQQSDFMDHLRALQAVHPSVKPGNLELEVLETSALEDMAQVSEVMHACREIGVSFALDDFGTGYSSLTYLKRLPATMLKIDKSFVREMHDDTDDLAILEGVLGMAAAFRRQVIAEGVETSAHGELLLKLGCELGQGYGIAHPMPAQELAGWAANWRPDPGWKNLPLLSRDDLPILYAVIEHRAWIKAIGEYLKGERQTPPPLDVQQSHFRHWLNGKGKTRHRVHLAFQTIEPLYLQVHALAEELLKLQTKGQNADALARLDELYDMRDALIGQLKILMQYNVRRLTT